MSTLSKEERLALYSELLKRQNKERYDFKRELNLCVEDYCKEFALETFVRCEAHMDSAVETVRKREKRKKTAAEKAARDAKRVQKRNERILASALRAIR